MTDTAPASHFDRTRRHTFATGLAALVIAVGLPLLAALRPDAVVFGLPAFVAVGVYGVPVLLAMLAFSFAAGQDHVDTLFGVAADD